MQDVPNNVRRTCALRLCSAHPMVLMGGTPGRIVKEWIVPIRQPRAQHLHRLIDLRMEIFETLSSSFANSSDS